MAALAKLFKALPSMVPIGGVITVVVILGWARFYTAVGEIVCEAAGALNASASCSPGEIPDLSALLPGNESQEPDTNANDDRQDAFVVRGGITTPEQLQRGVAEHRTVPGLTGFSVQSAPGLAVEQLAAAGQFPNRQISVTTVRELLAVDVRLEPSPGRGYHQTAVTPMPLPYAQAVAISTVFRQQPNPAPVRR